MNENNTSPKTSWRFYSTCAWEIGPFWGLINFFFLFKHNICGKGYICKFSSLLLNVCCVIELYWMSLNAPTLHLSLLPIMGLGNWWNLDFSSPMNSIIWHKKYVLVIIEHFWKWLELVPILDGNNECAIYTFLNRLISWFGIPTQMFINENMKFCKEFQEVFKITPIDHHTISWDHPCHNPNIGFVTNCEVQGPMRSRVCV
jgi:hypothetical protein